MNAASAADQAPDASISVRESNASRTRRRRPEVCRQTGSSSMTGSAETAKSGMLRAETSVKATATSRVKSRAKRGRDPIMASPAMISSRVRRKNSARNWWKFGDLYSMV